MRRSGICVPQSSGLFIWSPPIASLVWFSSSFSPWLQTICPYVMSLWQSGSMFVFWMKKIVVIPSTCPGTLHVNLPISFLYDVFQVSLYFGCFLKCLYLGNLPVFPSKIASVKLHNLFSGSYLGANFLAFWHLLWVLMETNTHSCVNFLPGMCSGLLFHLLLGWLGLVSRSQLPWSMKQSTLVPYSPFDLQPLPCKQPLFMLCCPWWFPVPEWGHTFSCCTFVVVVFATSMKMLANCWS